MDDDKETAQLEKALAERLDNRARDEAEPVPGPARVAPVARVTPVEDDDEDDDLFDDVPV